MRPQPLICVKDVEASSRWYQRLLGCQSAHGGPNYERLVMDGTLMLQLSEPRSNQGTATVYARIR
jgi:catechol-2,3-dioxygenase